MNQKSAKSLCFVKEEELSWLNTHSAPVTHTLLSVASFHYASESILFLCECLLLDLL